MLGLATKDDKKPQAAVKNDTKKADNKPASQNEEAQKVLAEINAKAAGDDCPFC